MTKNGTEKMYQSTYVLTRGSRTYLNAYIAIPHATPAAFVDLNRETNQIMSIDTEGINIYHLAKPYLYVNPTSTELLKKEFTFVVAA